MAAADIVGSNFTSCALFFVRVGHVGLLKSAPVWVVVGSESSRGAGCDGASFTAW